MRLEGNWDVSKYRIKIEPAFFSLINLGCFIEIPPLPHSEESFFYIEIPFSASTYAIFTECSG